MIDNVNKEVILFKGDLPAQENQRIQEAIDVTPVEDYTTSKMKFKQRKCKSKAMQTQQRQVTETITRDMPKSIAMTT
jgi:preprotein translocase subunit SecA